MTRGHGRLVYSKGGPYETIRAEVEERRLESLRSFGASE